MTPHAQCISDILAMYPRAKTHGFKATLNRALNDHEDLEPGVVSQRVGITPDAYVILPDVKTVICWEVSDHNRYKAGKYGPTFWVLDYVGWTLAVIEVDARNRAWRKVDLLADGIASDNIAKAQHDA